MDTMSLLFVTHVEQRLAREAAARHNLAVDARRDRTSRWLITRAGRRRPATVACATC